jgi:hypothetical protein
MTSTSRRRSDGAPRHRLEALESRRLLSAAIDGVGHCAQSDHHFSPNIGGMGPDGGYTPAQVRHAYGFDKITLPGGATPDGAGQTIAIVDAFHDPNIQSDVHVFSQKFGLQDPPTFKVVSQTGGSPAGLDQDSGWASEAALDVEWAHAIAPAANILLVEASSDDFDNLMAGVDYARRQPGVSVVSTSWGGSEFGGQTAYDTTFTTPKGHAGVTFVASSGDDASFYGAEWPATSPNVLSVGGTVLTVSDKAGTYGSEIAWNYSTGGSSTIERAPAYQATKLGARVRSAPDVSYNASVVHGFSVYSSVSDQGSVGWSNVGGTSAGAPQWAALVAIADQARALSGKSPLDGTSTTIPALYSLYSAPGSAGYSTYAANFRDITSGRVVGGTNGARAGYDNATGLGSPRAPAIVNALLNASPVAATSTKSKHHTAKPHLRPGIMRNPPPGGEIDFGTETAGDVSTPAVQPTAPVNAYIVRVNVDAGQGTDEPSRVDATLQVTTASERIADSSAATTMPQASWRPNVVYTFAPNYDTGDVALELPASGPGSGEGASHVVLNVVNTGTVANEVVAIADASPAGAAAAIGVQSPAAPKPVFNFAHPEAATAFADALAGFVHDSTLVGSIGAPRSTRGRAWTITGTVLALDAVMIGSWYASHRQAKRRKAALAAARFTPFSVDRVNW